MLNRLSESLGSRSFNSIGSNSNKSHASSTASDIEEKLPNFPASDRIGYDANPAHHRGPGGARKETSILGGSASIDSHDRVPYAYELVRSSAAEARFMGNSPRFGNREYNKALAGIEKNAKAEGFSPDAAAHLARHAHEIDGQAQAVVKQYKKLQDKLEKGPASGIPRASFLGKKDPRASLAALQALHDRLTSPEVLGHKEYELPARLWPNVEGQQTRMRQSLADYEAKIPANAVRRSTSGLSSQHSIASSDNLSADANPTRRMESLPEDHDAPAAPSLTEQIRRLRATHESSIASSGPAPLAPGQLSLAERLARLHTDSR